MFTPPTGSQPKKSQKGDYYVDAATGALKIYNGTIWETAGAKSMIRCYCGMMSLGGKCKWCMSSYECKGCLSQTGEDDGDPVIEYCQSCLDEERSRRKDPKVPSLLKTCNCNIRDLMQNGCNCGGFQREKGKQ